MTNMYHQQLINRERRQNLRKCIQLAKGMRLDVNNYPNQIYNDEYFTEREMIELRGLWLFSKHYVNMSGTEIEEFIKANENKLVVGGFISLYPGIVDEMRDHGLTYVCLAYRNNRVIQIEGQKLLEREQQLNK